MSLKPSTARGQYTNESMLKEILHYAQQYHAFYYGDEQRLSSTANQLLKGLRNPETNDSVFVLVQRV